MLTTTKPAAALGRAKGNVVAPVGVKAKSPARFWSVTVHASAYPATITESVGAGTATGTASSMDGPVVEARVPWHKKPCAFQELSSLDELLEVISPEGNGGRMTVIDFYAGWCACCKSSHPALCRIPGSTETLANSYNFYKANIEEPEFAAFIRKKGVRGIPHVLVFDSDGSDLIGLGASFKKLDALRRNLDAIARTPAGSRDFVLDPNGMAVHRSL